MAKSTPAPWQWDIRDSLIQLVHPKRGYLLVMDFVRKGMQRGQPRFAEWNGDERENMGGVMRTVTELDASTHPDMVLIAAAPDNALLLAAMVRGLARWEPLPSGSGEVCFGGIRYHTTLDDSGCPLVGALMRDGLTKLLAEPGNG